MRQLALETLPHAPGRPEEDWPPACGSEGEQTGACGAGGRTVDTCLLLFLSDSKLFGKLLARVGGGRGGELVGGGERKQLRLGRQNPEYGVPGIRGVSNACSHPSSPRPACPLPAACRRLACSAPSDTDTPPCKPKPRRAGGGRGKQESHPPVLEWTLLFLLYPHPLSSFLPPFPF